MSLPGLWHSIVCVLDPPAGHLGALLAGGWVCRCRYCVTQKRDFDLCWSGESFSSSVPGAHVFHLETEVRVVLVPSLSALGLFLLWVCGCPFSKVEKTKDEEPEFAWIRQDSWGRDLYLQCLCCDLAPVTLLSGPQFPHQ